MCQGMANFLSRNIRKTPAWRVIKCDSVEFNNLRYTEDDITFPRPDDVLRKLIEIKKGKRTVTNIPSNFSKHIHSIYLTEDMLYYQHNGKNLVIVPL